MYQVGVAVGVSGGCGMWVWPVGVASGCRGLSPAMGTIKSHFAFTGEYLWMIKHRSYVKHMAKIG